VIKLGLLGARAGLPDDHLIPPQPHHGVAAVIRRLAALAVVVELPVMPGPESHPATQAVARFKKLPQRFPREHTTIVASQIGTVGTRENCRTDYLGPSASAS
jgi:hypothetical protein